ncbi:MAG: iron ABC transporter permease [Candidatus Brocadiae bacterium]|nr:iron ABC transporter permease [Candidatus Brocadiia bacterium]
MFLVVFFLSIALSLTLGRYTVSLGNVFWDIQRYLQGNLAFQDLSPDSHVILIRIPRILMAILVGASLSASGMVYQCLFRNPLVSPDILGISPGACLGAAIAILFSYRHPFMIQSCAFFFGILAVFFTYRLALFSGGHTVIMLVMSGIVVSSFCTALLSLIKYTADPYSQLPAIVFWMMGGLHQVGWKELTFALPLVSLGLGMIYLLRRNLNLLSLGDEEARSLGMNVALMRLIFIVFSTVVVGATISITGVVGWIGLVIPHISRITITSDHTVSLPWAMGIGACFLLLIDTLARTITPQEIPIGIITALIGAPFFAYLLIFRKERGWGKW